VLSVLSEAKSGSCFFVVFVAKKQQKALATKPTKDTKKEKAFLPRNTRKARKNHRLARLAAGWSVCFRAFRFVRGEERFVFFRGFRGQEAVKALATKPTKGHEKGKGSFATEYTENTDKALASCTVFAKVSRIGVGVFPCFPFCPWRRKVRVFSWFSWLKGSKGVGHETHERARKDKGIFATEYAEGADRA